MKTKHVAWAVLGFCAGFAGACSSSEEQADATTAQAVMSELVSSVDTTVTGYQSRDGGAGTLELTCSPSGKASVDGHVKVAVNPVEVDVQVAIAYDACETSRGTTIDGGLDFTQTVQAGQQPVRVQTVYQGDVQMTGKVQADCTVDVTVLVDEAGRSVQVSGSVCGHDAADLDLQIAARWKS